MVKKNNLIVLCLFAFFLISCGDKTDEEYNNLIYGTWEWSEPWPHDAKEKMEFFQGGIYNKYNFDESNKVWILLYDSSGYYISKGQLYLKDNTDFNYNLYNIRKLNKSTMKLEHVNSGGRKVWKSKD